MSEETIDLLELEEKIKSTQQDVITWIVDFWHDTTKFTNISANKEKILDFAKLYYNYQVRLFEPDTSSEDLFFWHNNHVKIWIVGIKDKKIGENSTLLFATSSDIDEIETINCVDQTSSPIFYKIDSPKQQIQFLIDNKLIPDISKKTVSSSINNQSGVNYWINSWVKTEETNAESLIVPSTELIDFNKVKIRAKRYDFKEMIDIIADKQFTIELDECLYAYNNEKWFVCAAGLGGVLEHLLYLVLDKNNMIDKQFPDNATYSDYIGYMKKDPINIGSRQKTMIKNIFNIRNSVSHFNQGFTSKDQCSYLMSGIKEIFNNYYLKEFTTDSK